MRKFWGAAALAAFVLTVSVQVAGPRAYAQTPDAIPASHVTYVYPDSPQTSNNPFPPNQNEKFVHKQLREVMVRAHGQVMSLGQYLRSTGTPASKVVTVKIQGGHIAVYTYR